MRVYVALFFVCLSLGLASGLEFEPSYSTKILVDELQEPITAFLEITDAPVGEYNVYTLADITIEPSDIFTIRNGSVTKAFAIEPNQNFGARGAYTFTYTLHHRGVEKVEERLTIDIKNLGDILRVGSDSIDPSNEQVSFYVENTEDVPVSNVTARFSSVLFDITRRISLEPLEKQYLTVEVDSNKLKKTKAGVYIIDAVFETKKGNVPVSGNLYLGEKKGITTTEDNAGFLVTTKTVNKVNTGNVLEDVEIKVQKNMISRLFTSFNSEPHFVSRNGIWVEYAWIKKRLGPGEVFTIKAKTNYLIPFIIVLLFIVAFVVLRRVMQKKIELVKTVHPVKTKNGEFALRVRINLKAKKHLENVTLIDKVPGIVKIYKKFGTPQPDKIDLESRRLHWKIGDLDVGEERAFSYIVYSKVGYVGKFSLPPALAVFEKEGELHETESNRIFFMSDQISSEE